MVEIFAKNVKFGCLNSILGKLGVTHGLGIDGSLESPWSIELSSLCGVIRRNVYSWAVLAGGRPLCTDMLPGHCRPHHLFLVIFFRWQCDFLGEDKRTAAWCQKTSDTGLPDGEDRIPLRSLVFIQYWRVTDRQTDGRTDGRICRSIYSACKAILRGAL